MFPFFGRVCFLFFFVDDDSKQLLLSCFVCVAVLLVDDDSDELLFHHVCFLQTQATQTQLKAHPQKANRKGKEHTPTHTV